ncbi:MAG TPA: hypothetical protein VGF10_14810 [Gaiella sp.]|jgi:hypothetical protein
MLLAAAVLVAVLLAGAAQARIPPETDGSTYTWAGAATVTVDASPWGGGYVRSAPYLIDCPLACVRPFDQGRDVTFTAYPTPGFTFDSWQGACAGQANPCSLKIAGATLDVTAVFTGHYVPPPPPAPTLTVGVSGPCPGCTASAVGTGFAPNSTIDLDVTITSPPLGSVTLPGFAETDANGNWSYAGPLGCDFGEDPYVGPFDEDITARDSAGGSAFAHLSAMCVAPG